LIVAPKTTTIIVTNGSISVYNNGGYFARFSISFQTNGTPNTLSTGKFSQGQKRTLNIPDGSCYGQVIAEKEVLIGSWQQIFSLNFDLPYEQCFKVGGTTLNSNWVAGC
jgi:hypothetical protein